MGYVISIRIVCSMQSDVKLPIMGQYKDTVSVDGRGVPAAQTLHNALANRGDTFMKKHLIMLVVCGLVFTLGNSGLVLAQRETIPHGGVEIP